MDALTLLYSLPLFLFLFALPIYTDDTKHNTNTAGLKVSQIWDLTYSKSARKLLSAQFLFSIKNTDMTVISENRFLVQNSNGLKG